MISDLMGDDEQKRPWSVIQRIQKKKEAEIDESVYDDEEEDDDDWEDDDDYEEDN